MADKITAEQQLAEIRAMVTALLIRLDGSKGAIRMMLEAESFGVIVEMVGTHLEGKSFTPIAEERMKNG